ncbi:NAD-dependent epimerase/dehydratase family protein, partial [Streptomyces sp. NRRL B-24085]|uniref:NAD-dependent epimerase/dehydratase family protein n=1 Tax=Streptomyces sp. NRRL B-24085 TaxID=1709476 RepID=UPI00211B2842
MQLSRIAVAGASGLIGSALVRSLTADGHEVVRLVRREPRDGEVRWDPEAGRVDTAGLAGCDAVVNLAGAGVGSRRWTEAYKKRIRDSRVNGTSALARAVASLDEPPKVFVNGSAMGYYGETGDRVVDESSPPGEGFLPELCVEWDLPDDEEELGRLDRAEWSPLHEVLPEQRPPYRPFFDERHLPDDCLVAEAGRRIL